MIEHVDDLQYCSMKLIDDLPTMAAGSPVVTNFSAGQRCAGREAFARHVLQEGYGEKIRRESLDS
jgi:hypothetical protein